MPMQHQPHAPMQLETLRWTGYSDILALQANDHPYGMQSTSPHNNLYGYRYKAPTYDAPIPYAVSMSNAAPLSRVSAPPPVYSTSPSLCLAYPMANHFTARGAAQTQHQQNLQSQRTSRSEKAYQYVRPSVARAAAHVANPSRLASGSSLDTKQDAVDVRLATSAPHHGALFRELSEPFVTLSAERQLADLQKQNAALKKELEDLTAQLDETNAQGAMQQLQTRQLESELHKLKAKLTSAEAAAASPELEHEPEIIKKEKKKVQRSGPPPKTEALKEEASKEEEAHSIKDKEANVSTRGQLSDASLEQHFVDWQMFNECVQALKQLDDKSLKQEFQHFADIKKCTDDCRMSKDGLAALFAARKKTLSKGEVEELMMRIDTSGDGQVDWHEFRALIRSSSDLEMLFKSFPLALVLAFCFPRGSTDAPLKPFFGMQRGEVVTAVQKAAFILVKMTMKVIDEQNAAENKNASDGGGDGGKFGAELKGRSFKDFFEGVTGIVGEPHPDTELGMAEEHLLKEDSNEMFTTGNYSISTCPAMEYVAVYKAMGIDTGPAWKVVQDFMKSSKGSGWLTSADLTKKSVTSHGQTLEETLVPWTRRCRQRDVQQIPEDLRVLHPIEYFGNFDHKGRLSSPSVCATDTPLQRKVKRANLTRQEIVGIIMYTGPCFILYNGLLRGFGNCGEVPASEDVEYACGRFWQLLSMKTVADRMKKAGHRFPSTMHVIASGIKKLQIIAEEGQGTWLFRGLGGLDVRPFMASEGFTESAFMSMTANMDVALEYSGVKDGKPATVLAVELSKVDNGAEIYDFSQYPGERETVWNTCAYLEYLHGRDEIRVTQWGVVRVLKVKPNANTKALTVEELEERRKKVVVALFDTIHNDVVREIDNCVQTKQFQERVKVAYAGSDKCPDKDLYVSPLKWKEAGSEKPSTGTEIKNGPLAAALQEQVELKKGEWADLQIEFKKEEWKDFKVSFHGELVNPEGKFSRSNCAADLSSDSYIKFGNRYFKPEIKPYKDLFIDSIKSESAARAEVYKSERCEWFSSNANLGKAVIDGLALSTLAKAHYDLWLRDESLQWICYDADDMCTAGYSAHLFHDYQRSYGKLLELQRKELNTLQLAVGAQELTEAEEAALEVEGSDDDAAKRLEAAKRLQALALEECVSRRWITDEKGLEHLDETTSFTPLMTHLTLGDLKVAERLLQARASPEAVPTKDKEGKTPLLWACKEEDVDATLLLLKYKANIEATDTSTYRYTALMWATYQRNADIVRLLVKHGASLETVGAEGTALEIAQRENVENVVAVLEEHMATGGEEEEKERTERVVCRDCKSCWCSRVFMGEDEEVVKEGDAMAGQEEEVEDGDEEVEYNCGGEGSSVEVKSEGQWWDAIVSEVRDDKIKVHYVGGTEEEDEWIALNSGRLCLPKNT